MNDWWAGLNQWPARRWFFLALGFLVVVYGYAVWHNQSTTLPDGRLAFWLHDDMMISMHYARNLVQGDGLVWNPGQPPVEGYSNFGWLLVMSAVHTLPLPDTLTSLVMLILNVALAALVLWLTTRLAHRLVPRPGVWLLAALVTLALAVDLARWTTIGLEVPLLTAVFLWLLIRVLDDAAVNQPRLSTFFLAGLLGLIRVDGPLLAFILVLIALSLQRDKRRVLAYAPLALFLPLAHVLFRLGYYGQPLPNTYYLKLVAWESRLGPGLAYVGRFIRLYWPLLLGAGTAVYLTRDKRLTVLLLAGLPLAVYSLYTGGDDFGGARFFAPWLPVLALLAFLGLDKVPLAKRPYLTIGLLAGLVLVTAVTAGYRFYVGPGEESHMALAGEVMEAATWPTSTVGVFWAGTLPYYAHRPGVDMLGKNDAVVARLPAHEGSLKPGHNKFDYEFSLNEHQPDLVVSPMNLGAVADPQQFPAYTEGDGAYAGQLFLNETFQTNYAPTLVYIGDVPLFIHTASPERERLMEQSDCEPVTHEELIQFGLETVCWYGGRS